MTTEQLLQRCVYRVNDDGWCETEWEDGRKLQALPNMDDESIKRARNLGYEGTDAEVVWAMTREHDFIHSVLAEAQSWRYSRSLRVAISPCKLSPHTQATVAREEALVLCVQRLLNHVRKTGNLLV